ncbi:hypothetical protein ACVU7I_17070 [Patulibacter sp. S7RM1-6]
MADQPPAGSEQGGVAARRLDPAAVDRDGDGRPDLTPRDIRDRQREKFGGFHFGPAIFGWLVAIGISVILAAILSAAGAAIGLTSSDTDVSSGEAKTIGIAGGVLLVLVFVIAYYCGGYVAGRMVRFDGARQGFGTWVIGIAITILLGILGAIAGSQYNVFEKLNLPSLPISGTSLTTGGAVTALVILVASLVAAVLGGRAGERFHRRIDRAGV